MSTAYFIAERKVDGTVGKPMGDENGGVWVFDELTNEVWKIKDEVQTTTDTQLGIFMVDIKVVGEVST